MPANPFDSSDVAVSLGGRFQIDGELRVGGQGVVYRARRERGPQGAPAADLVALKLHTDPGQDQRVEREIAAMERVRHPNLAKLVEHGRVLIGGQQVRYVAWEFIDGQPLDHRIQDAGPVAPRIVACLGRDVASAIGEIWARRIVHRDVNPKNIMLRTGDLEAVLIDLGVARFLSEDTITAAGLTWGTRGYLSPEQCRAETALTCSSDVFSLGVTLQEALCGAHPTSLDQRRLATAPPRTSDVAPNAPAALADTIDRMLSLRAAFRPRPAELAERFGELAESL